MPAYFSLGTKNSEAVSDKYLQINNCGFCEDMDKTAVNRPQGRKDYQLIYIKYGQMEFHADGQVQTLTDGYIYLYRPGTPQHYRIAGKRSTFFWIHFTGTAVPEMLEDIPSGAIKVGFYPIFERFCKSFYLECRTFQNAERLIYDSAFIQVLGGIAERVKHISAPRCTSNIATVLLTMNRTIEKRLNNDELATIAHLSKYHFIREFKAATGQTPQQYYTQLVLDTAKVFLETTDYPIAQVATMCGVDDVFYFSRLFKKHTGLSPAAFRKRLPYGGIAKNH